MSEAFHTLLVKSLSNEISQEERQQVTNELLALYQSPQSTLDILQFLLNEQNVLIRHAASIGLKKSLQNNWKSSICKSDFHEPVKETIIAIFQNETEQLILHAIVQGIKPIFKTDICKWTQLFELVTSLTNDKTRLDAIEFSLYLITYFTCYLSEALLEANLPFFLDLCNFSFETGNQQLIDTACGLVAVLIGIIDDEELPMMVPAFTKMLDIYSISLSSDDSYAYRISNKLSFAFKKRKDLPLPNDAILSRLFEVAPQNPIIAFTPINQFIETCGKKLSNLFPTIIQQTLAFATALFVDAPLEENDNSMYVLNAIGNISQKIKPRIFFPKFLGMLSTNSLPETIISAMAISYVISNSQEAVTKNISQLSKFILNVLQLDHICAKEVALDIIKDIAILFEEGKSDISRQFMEPLVQLLNLNQPELIKHTLSTLRKLLECTDIDVKLIGPTLQALSGLLTPDSHVPAEKVFDVISALVFSAGEDVAPFVDALFPLIVQTASIPEEKDPNLKANSIEALSHILRFSNLTDELVNQALSLIVASGQTNDFDIRSSVMISLSNILAHKLPQILNFADPIQKLIYVYISEAITSEKELDQYQSSGFNDDGFDDEDSDFDEIESIFASNQNQLNSRTNTFLLIKNIYKLCPQLALQDPSLWFKFSVSSMITINEDLSIAATLASLYMLLNVKNLPDSAEFFEKLKINFEGGSACGPSVVSCCFKAIRRFMENDYPLPEEVINYTLNQGKLALAGDLPCQDEDEVDTDTSILTLSMQVNYFFAVLATKFPNIFPTNDYIKYEEHISSTLKNSEESDEFGISQCVGVLRQLYINSGNGSDPSHFNLTSLQRKFIIKAFIRDLKICDFSVLPEPLIAVRNVLERESDKILPHIQLILDFINNLFNIPYESQMHYWSTMTNAASFLCSLMKLNLESFDLNLISKILPILPVKGDEMEAENIYGTLIWLITETPVGPEIVNQFGSELIRILAQTLGLKDKVLNSFKLSPKTAQGMTNLLNNLMNQIPNAAAIFEQSFTDDPLSQSRCQQRLAPQPQ
ncbi:hypothetical protein M9Y10_037846 [Tritrichomonas musculus]|uniref:Importin N-terminal domain-containing protein n=1 Tax=Tritrichomonas musculus TaxID=1915356 RepID=A0ABR2K7H4_9EUKA